MIARVLLTGAGGLLGSCMARRLAGTDLVTVGRDRLDPRDTGAIERLVAEVRPEIVVNCAAHVNADIVENDPVPAVLANALLPLALARACRRSNALLVHFSSTGCYGDWKSEPYVEDDAVNPTSVHHKSKIAGEAHVRDSGCEFLIIRTGWLFGGSAAQPKNFVWRRLEEAIGQASLVSDNRQIGNPTYVEDVAAQTRFLIEERITGLYNVVGHNAATRFEYVSKIVELAGLNCAVRPSERPFVRAARMSHNESAINQRLAYLGLDRMTDWRESLSRYLETMRNTPEWRQLLKDTDA